MAEVKLSLMHHKAALIRSTGQCPLGKWLDAIYLYETANHPSKGCYENDFRMRTVGACT